jgi:hypothetical protein
MKLTHPCTPTSLLAAAVARLTSSSRSRVGSNDWPPPLPYLRERERENSPAAVSCLVYCHPLSPSLLVTLPVAPHYYRWWRKQGGCEGRQRAGEVEQKSRDGSKGEKEREWARHQCCGCPGKEGVVEHERIEVCEADKRQENGGEG